MNLYQLLNDGEQSGLLNSIGGKMDDNVIEKEWENYTTEFGDDVDEFATILNEKYPHSNFERVFTTEINN